MKNFKKHLKTIKKEASGHSRTAISGSKNSLDVFNSRQDTEVKLVNLKTCE